MESKLREALESSKSVEGYGFDQDYLDQILDGASKDAEKILKDAEYESKKSIEPIDSTKLRDALGEEQYESLTMPSHLFESFTTKILEPISKAINPDWRPGDVYTESLQVTIQALIDTGFVDDIVIDLESK